MRNAEKLNKKQWKGKCEVSKEDERLLSKVPEQNLYLPVPSGEVRRLETGPLSLMLAQVVRDLDALPFLRSSEELPEAIRYLRNPNDGILVMVSRRRPTSIAYRGSEVILEAAHTYGYFAEAYEEVNGIPQHKITNPSTVWSGAYEPIDISDQGDYHDAGLTPTNFTGTRRTILGLSRESHLSLPEGRKPFQLTEGEETEIIEQHGIGETGALVIPEEPVIAKLFEVANAQAAEMEKVGHGIKASIRGKFIPTSQGLSPEVGLAHLVITDESDSSQLLSLSSKLGLQPHTIPFWRMTHNLSPYIRHVIRRGGKASEIFPLDQIPDIENHKQDSIKMFKEQANRYPMVVTLDTKALTSAVHQRDYDGSRQELVYNIAEASGKHPLFSIIEIGDDLEGDAVVKRQSSGRYLFKGENVADMQGLLVKIGVDYALTKQVRGLTTLVSSL